VQAFRDGFWPELPVYLDASRAFYDALGGGKANQSTLAGFLARLVNPFGRLYKNSKRAGDTKGNLVGEGFIHGGMYVVKAGGEAVLAHAEEEIGDHPPIEAVLAACKKTQY